MGGPGGASRLMNARGEVRRPERRRFRRESTAVVTEPTIEAEIDKV